MKRVAILSHGASGGGSERVATLLANSLCEEYEVFFYAMHSSDRGYHIEDKVKYEFCDVTGKNKVAKMIGRMQKLKRFVKENRIDIIISFIYIEGLSIVNLKGVKKIFSLRNDPNQIKNKKFELKAIEYLYRKADCVVFQTEDARDFFGESIRKHGVVIPNPIKDNLPYWNKDNHKKEIIAVGRLSEQKNFAMLVKAFALFHKVFPEYSLTICGDGPLRENLQVLIKEKALEEAVNLIGFVNDVHERMSTAEIYVSSSDFEGISNSMLEALAIGIPTVCTDCPIGGAKMFINDGKNGYLVPVGDYEKLAEKLSEVAGKKGVREQFFAESTKIKETLSLSNITKKWKEVI